MFIFLCMIKIPVFFYLASMWVIHVIQYSQTPCPLGLRTSRPLNSKENFDLFISLHHILSS